MPNKNAAKVKFQFEMPLENAARLEELASQAGVTKREIIHNALVLLEWAILESQKGRIIASVDEKEKNKYRQVILPVLNTLGLANKK